MGKDVSSARVRVGEAMAPRSVGDHWWVPRFGQNSGCHTFCPEATLRHISPCALSTITRFLLYLCVDIYVDLQQTFRKQFPSCMWCTLHFLFYSTQFWSIRRQYSAVVRSMASDARLPGFKPGLTTFGNLFTLPGPSVLICKTRMATVPVISVWEVCESM